MVTIARIKIIKIKDICEAKCHLSTLKPVNLGNQGEGTLGLVLYTKKLTKMSDYQVGGLESLRCQILPFWNHYIFPSFYEDKSLHMICHTWVQLLS